MDQGMHCLDLFRYFLGEFCEVTAFTETYYWDMPVEDNAFALLRTQSRKIASLHVSWTEWRNVFALQIVGKKGYIEIEGLGASYGTELGRLGLRDFYRPFSERTIRYTGGDKSWIREWLNFTQAIENNIEPNGSLEDGLKALVLAKALYDSARSKKVVRLGIT